MRSGPLSRNKCCDLDHGDGTATVTVSSEGLRFAPIASPSGSGPHPADHTFAPGAANLRSQIPRRGHGACIAFSIEPCRLYLKFSRRGASLRVRPYWPSRVPTPVRHRRATSSGDGPVMGFNRRKVGAGRKPRLGARPTLKCSRTPNGSSPLERSRRLDRRVTFSLGCPVGNRARCPTVGGPRRERS
jgi:hypothetical protein